MTRTEKEVYKVLMQPTWSGEDILFIKQAGLNVLDKLAKYAINKLDNKEASDDDLEINLIVNTFVKLANYADVMFPGDANVLKLETEKVASKKTKSIFSKLLVGWSDILGKQKLHSTYWKTQAKALEQSIDRDTFAWANQAATLGQMGGGTKIKHDIWPALVTALGLGAGAAGTAHLVKELKKDPNEEARAKQPSVIYAYPSRLPVSNYLPPVEVIPTPTYRP
jgi:hypothetical protein